MPNNYYRMCLENKIIPMKYDNSYFEHKLNEVFYKLKIGDYDMYGIYNKSNLKWLDYRFNHEQIKYGIYAYIKQLKDKQIELENKYFNYTNYNKNINISFEDFVCKEIFNFMIHYRASRINFDLKREKEILQKINELEEQQSYDFFNAHEKKLNQNPFQ